jgi:hypothetical protein
MTESVVPSNLQMRLRVDLCGRDQCIDERAEAAAEIERLTKENRSMNDTISRCSTDILRLSAALERITTFREGEICQNIAREALMGETSSRSIQRRVAAQTGEPAPEFLGETENDLPFPGEHAGEGKL